MWDVRTSYRRQKVMSLICDVKRLRIQCTYTVCQIKVLLNLCFNNPVLHGDIVYDTKVKRNEITEKCDSDDKCLLLTVKQ